MKRHQLYAYDAKSEAAILFLNNDPIDRIQRGVVQQAKVWIDAGLKVFITTSSLKIDKDTIKFESLSASNFIQINFDKKYPRAQFNFVSFFMGILYVGIDLLLILKGTLRLNSRFAFKQWIIDTFSVPNTFSTQTATDIAEVIKQIEPKIIVSSNSLLTEIIRNETFIGKVVIWHAAEFASANQSRGSRIVRGKQIAERKLSKLAQTIIVDNQFLVQAISKHFKISPEKFLTVSNAPSCTQDVYPPVSLRFKFGIDESSIVIFFYGHLIHNRYLIELLEFHSKFAPTNVHIVFLGSGPLEPEIIRISSLDNRIHHENWFDNATLCAYIRESDYVFIVYDHRSKNSRIGGPNKLYDAIANQVPIIANLNCDYISSIVRIAHCGILINPLIQDNWQTLFSKLERRLGPSYERPDSLLWDSQSEKLSRLATQIHNLNL